MDWQDVLRSANAAMSMVAMSLAIWFTAGRWKAINNRTRCLGSALISLQLGVAWASVNGVLLSRPITPATAFFTIGSALALVGMLMRQKTDT